MLLNTQCPGNDLLGSLPILAWLPHEPLFSSVSRYHLISGNRLASVTCQQFFGSSRAGTQHDFPCRLDELERRTSGLLGNAESIIRDHTILPYFLPFRAPEDEADAIAAMRSNAIGSLKFRLGLLTSSFRANHPLKACLECMKADLADYGTPYWHLGHQYPGVNICTEHCTPLLHATVKANGVERFLWQLPNRQQLELSTDLLALGSASHQKLTELAQLASGVASVPVGIHFEPARLTQVYRKRLTLMGLTSRGGRLNVARIGQEFSWAMRDVHRRCEFRGALTNNEEAGSRLARLLRPARSGTHPLRHLILIQWLFCDWTTFLRAYDASQDEPQPEACPVASQAGEKLAHQLVDPRAPHLVRLLQVEMLSVSAAAIVVGVDTTTAMVWAARAGHSTSRRAKVLKPPIRKLLIRDLGNGLDKRVVADRFGVSVQTVTTLLRTEVGLHQRWCDALHSRRRSRARTAWLHAREKFGVDGIKAVRTREPSAYAWLYRNDRAWLIQQNEFLPSGIAGNHSSVKWDERDTHLAKAVLDAALQLDGSHPGKRLLLWQLAQKLPELKAKLGALHRLPLTERAIRLVVRSRRANDSEDSRALF